jgi:threonine dehydratase
MKHAVLGMGAVGGSTGLPLLNEIEAAATIVYRFMPPTPQYRWPLLEERTNRRLWVKHENHTPVGAFKVRGGLAYFERLTSRPNVPRHAICATRGNHGQSVAFAARQYGIAVTIVVPHNNSVGKNEAMRALGAQVVEYGEDFQAAYEYALALAERESLHLVPAFHQWLVCGVATYALELFRNAELDVLYVPVGMGSGIIGSFAARDALGLNTEIVAVVADNAPALALSLERGAITSAWAQTFADGVACRTPDAEAFSMLKELKPRVVRVSETQIADAVRRYFSDTHNVAEGAGALSLAAALADPERDRYQIAGAVLSGGNVDAVAFARVLNGSAAG